MGQDKTVTSKIIQLIPAYGWFAVYGEKENPDTWKTLPLIAWALVEVKTPDTDLGTVMCGVDVSGGDLSLVRTKPNFLRYRKATE